MTRIEIPSDRFIARPDSLWSRQWFALTSGNMAQNTFNTMTVAWGGFGTMWAKPFVQIVVRPSRYTFQFMEKHSSFTLCAFPKSYKKALQVLGTKSGRDCNKIAEAGLTPVSASVVAAPLFDEAELAIECRKMYWDDMKPENFLDKEIESNYPDGDYHRIYFGEIMAITGTERFNS